MINMTSKNSRLDEISTLHTTTWLMLENQNKLNFAGSAGETGVTNPQSQMQFFFRQILNGKKQPGNSELII